MDVISRAIEAVSDSLPNVWLRRDEPMKNHTSFKIGGPVRAMFFPNNAAALTELYVLLSGLGVRPAVIGKGTNLLADDRALDIVVINTTGLNDLTRASDTEIVASAGVLLSKLAVFACECGLSGIEFAHGIPGTLGGAVSMNAGAYGGEMKDVVHSTRALSPEACAFTLTGVEHGFSYRRSRFADTGDVILSSAIRLKSDDAGSIKERMEELNMRRHESQPLDLPSAGSTFKRPEGGYAAVFIERAGLKGFSIGGAQVSEKHSGFVVNRRGASFSDVMAVIEYVRETVFRQFGVELELEIKILRSERNER
jgi:UDP-N-acetylmuramate dehydrogenase